MMINFKQLITEADKQQLVDFVNVMNEEGEFGLTKANYKGEIVNLVAIRSETGFTPICILIDEKIIDNLDFEV